MDDPERAGPFRLSGRYAAAADLTEKARALGPACAPFLEQVVARGEPPLRLAALEALFEIDAPRGEPLAIHALEHDDDELVRAAAARLLVGSEAAVPALGRAADAGSDWAERALRTRARGRPSSDLAAELALPGEGRTSAWTRAAETLAERTDDDALAALRSLIEQRAVDERIVAALCGSGN